MNGNNKDFRYGSTISSKMRNFWRFNVYYNKFLKLAEFIQSTSKQLIVNKLHGISDVMVHSTLYSIGIPVKLA